MSKRFAMFAAVLCMVCFNVAANPARFAVHQFASSEAAILANGYVIETRRNLIVVDATLTVSSSKNFKAFIDALKKPVVAYLVTHAHPDHYNGLAIITAGSLAPIYATQEVRDSIAAIDGPKELQWRPVFKDEWPSPRRFPNTTIDDGHWFKIDGVTLTIHSIGAAESNADSIWTASAGGQTAAFVGDLLFNGTHSYMCDGHSSHWLDQIDRTESQAKKDHWNIYPGHGAPIETSMSAAAFEWQRRYIHRFQTLVSNYGPEPMAELQKNTLTQVLASEMGAKGLEFLVAACAQAVADEMKRQP